MNAEQIRAWRTAAEADGWRATPTYKTESIEQAATLCLGPAPCQWVALVILRPKYASLAVWGPDALALEPGIVYDFPALEAKLRTCPICDVEDVPTYRHGFGGRACEVCLPAAREESEYPGWTN